MGYTWLIVWIVIMVICLIVEAITMGLTTIWFAGGALLTAILAGLGAPVVIQFLVFAIVSVVLLYFTRPIVERGFNRTRIKTNSEGLIGKHAYVKEEIDNVKGTGAIKVDGLEWTARTQKDGMIIAEGALVEIKGIDGVKALVAEVKED